MSDDEIIPPDGKKKSTSRSRQVVEKTTKGEITATEKEEPSREISDPVVFGEYLKQDDELAKSYLQQRMEIEKKQAEFELTRQQKLLDLEEAERVHKLELERQQFENDKEKEMLSVRTQELENVQKIKMMQDEITKNNDEDEKIIDTFIASRQIYLMPIIVLAGYVIGNFFGNQWSGVVMSALLAGLYLFVLGKTRRLITQDVIRDFIKLGGIFKR